MSDYTNGWEVPALPEGSVLRIGDERYTITDAEPRAGGSSIFYRARREGSSLPYGVKECCPLELRDRLRRVNGLLVGTDEHAEKLLADARERLQTEAKISQEIAARSGRIIPVLEAPGQLRIEAAGSQTAAPAGNFLLMRHMGSTGLILADLLSECALPPQEGYPLRTGGRPSLRTAALIIEQTLKALDLVHRAGYVYGDLQPGNLFFCDPRPAAGDIGFAALLDFGCARALTDGRQTAPITDRLVFTTPGYAAPELRFANDGTLRLTPAADVYSAGRLLLYLLRGRTYVENGWDGTLHDRLFDGERSLIRILPCEAENLGCDDETLRLLQELLDKALAGEPKNRWPDAAAMLEAAEKLVRRTAPPPNRLALSFSALAKGEFLGREEQLVKIDEALREHRSPVVIWGFAGMGKTELAIEFARRYHRGQAYFVRFQASVLETVTGPIADAFSGYSRRDLHGREKPEEQICREVLTLLAQRSENDLLVIDDIEDLTAHRGEAAFRELCALPMQLMITTRTETDGGVEADTLPRPLLHTLLHRFDRKNAPLSDELADRLIDAAEGHTLTVELIGRTLKYSIPRISPESLLQKLKAGDLDSDAFAKVSTAKDREGKLERIQGHLETLFRLNELPEKARSMMGYALPISSAGFFLEDFAAQPDFDQEVLRNLINLGYLRLNEEDLLTIHPLVQKAGWSMLPIDLDDCILLISENTKTVYDHSPSHRKTLRLELLIAYLLNVRPHVEENFYQRTYLNSHLNALLQIAGRFPSMLRNAREEIDWIETHPENDPVWKQQPYSEVLNRNECLIYAYVNCEVACSFLNQKEEAEKYEKLQSALGFTWKKQEYTKEQLRSKRYKIMEGAELEPDIEVFQSLVMEAADEDMANLQNDARRKFQQALALTEKMTPEVRYSCLHGWGELAADFLEEDFPEDAPIWREAIRKSEEEQKSTQTASREP